MKRLRKYQSFLIVSGVILVFFSGIYLFLFSGYSIKHFWFPVLEGKTGIRITADECSVSLLSRQTFSGKGVKISHPDFSANAKKIELTSSVWSYLFHGCYQIQDLTVQDVSVVLRETTVPVKTKTAKPPAGKKSPEKKKKFRVEDIQLPLDIRQILITDLQFQMEKKNGDLIHLNTGNLHFLRHGRETTVPKRYEITTNGLLSFRYGNIQLNQSYVHTKTDFTLLKNIVFPERFSFHLNTADADFSAGDFSSKGNSLALIAELEVKNSALYLKSGSVSMGNEKGGDILSVNLSGAAKKEFAGADLRGAMKLYPSDLMDALCSNLFRISVKGLSAECRFESKFEQDQLHSSADLTVISKQVSPYQDADTPLSEPEIRMSAEFTGIPKTLTFRLNKADLDIRQEKKKIGKMKLLSPWNVLKNGKLLFSPLPHAEIRMDHFPLSALVPFGLDRKYREESISFHAASKPGKKEHAELEISGSTSFEVAQIGPLSVQAFLSASPEQLELQKGKIFCGTAKQSIAADFSGRIHQKTKSFELDADTKILQPEMIFRSELFRGFPEISPKLQLRGLMNSNTADLFLELSGGKYKCDLISKFKVPQSGDDFWEGKKTSFRFYSGNQSVLECFLDFRIPGTGTEQLEISAETGTVDSAALQEIFSRILPENLDLSHSVPAAAAVLRSRDGIFSAAGNLNWKNLLLKNPETGKNIRWDNSFSAAGDFKNGIIDLRKCSFQTSLDNAPAADLNLTGTVPAADKPILLVLHSKITDLQKLFQLKALLIPETAEQIMQKPAGGTGKATGKTPTETQQSPMPVIHLRDGSRITLKMQKISYGKDLIADYQGNLSVKGNTLFLKTDSFTVNGEKADLGFSVDPGHADGYPFSLQLKLKNLPLEPLSQFIGKGKEKYISGALNTLTLNAAGKGFSPDDLIRRGSADIIASVSDLSISAGPEARPVIQLILIPLNGIQTALESNRVLSETVIGKELSVFSRKLQDIVSGKKNLQFASANINADFKNSVLTMNKLEFLNGIVESESITGTIVIPDSRINLKSETVVFGILFPVHAGGTLQKFKVDLQGSLKHFLQKSTKSLLKKKNLKQTIESVDKIIELFN